MLPVVLVLLIIISVYLYSLRTYSYWKKKGVKHDVPIPILGTNAKGFFMQRSKTQLAADMYWKYPNERVVGFFVSSTPELIIRDPELVKVILLNDFESFNERGLSSYHENAKDPLTRHLFNADGDLWRLLRQRLTPAFTTSKLRTMFPLVVERVNRLQTRIRAASEAPIDARDLMARFATDFIGAYGFDLDMDALTNDDSEFRKLGKNIIDTTMIDVIKDFLREILPMVLGKKIFWQNKYGDDFLILFRTILQHRNYESTGRNDFVDLLLECRNRGSPSIAKEKYNDKATFHTKVDVQMTDDLIAAQAFIFFAAGFEPASFTTSFTLHLLAYHPDKQEKVQMDVDRAFARHDNKFSYEAIQDMPYLEWAFKESMRIFPSVGVLLRQCTRKYRFSGIDLTIDKGVKIKIPVQAMQNDPKYFDSPEEFRPERFDPKNLDVEKTKYVYLPFGDGLRSCIGIKLAMMQSLAGLAAVLSQFSVEPAASTVRHPCMEFTPLVIQSVKGGLPLLFRERQNKSNVT